MPQTLPPLSVDRPDTTGLPVPDILLDDWPVPDCWRARGFSGLFTRRAWVAADLVAKVDAMMPCLAPRDMAWLLLELEHADGLDGDGSLIMVRNDAAARVDLYALERGFTGSPSAWPGGWP